MPPGARRDIDIEIYKLPASTPRPLAVDGLAAKGVRKRSSSFACPPASHRRPACLSFARPARPLVPPIASCRVQRTKRRLATRHVPHLPHFPPRARARNEQAGGRNTDGDRHKLPEFMQDASAYQKALPCVRGCVRGCASSRASSLLLLKTLSQQSDPARHQLQQT